MHPHTDAFPADKDKFLSALKPLELENFKTQTKTGTWGILLNVCIKYEGPLLKELDKICKVSK